MFGSREVAPVTPMSTEQFMTAIVEAANNPKVDIEKMNGLLDMYERVQSKRAESAWNEAMRRCQEEMPKIVKTKANPYAKSNYAPLEEIQESITPVYTKNGFSLSFGTADSPLTDHYRVTCDVAHSEGHSRQYVVDIPRDDVGPKGEKNKTPTWAFGSSMSYGQRYLVTLIFNLRRVGEDDDGARAGAQTITEAQIRELSELIAELNKGEEFKQEFLRYCKVSDLSEIPQKSFAKAKGVLEAKREQ